MGHLKESHTSTSESGCIACTAEVEGGGSLNARVEPASPANAVVEELGVAPAPQPGRRYRPASASAPGNLAPSHGLWCFYQQSLWQQWRQVSSLLATAPAVTGDQVTTRQTHKPGFPHNLPPLPAMVVVTQDPGNPDIGAPTTLITQAATSTSTVMPSSPPPTTKMPTAWGARDEEDTSSGHVRESQSLCCSTFYWNTKDLYLSTC